jgi:hypothetical protein
MYTPRFLTSRLRSLVRNFPVVVVSGARDGRFFPIEIKGKTSVTRADARGIKAFREAYPGLNLAPGLIIALCERVERVSPEAFSLPWDLGGQPGARNPGHRMEG